MNLNDFIEERSTYREGQASIIFYNLFVMTNRIQTSFDNIGEDITFKQFMLLIVINIQGSGSYTEFGAIMGSSRQNIKNLAVALSKKGYVTISQDPNDRRASRITATPKIDEHFERMNKKYDSAMTALFEDFSDKEIQILLELIPKFMSGIQRLE